MSRSRAAGGGGLVLLVCLLLVALVTSATPDPATDVRRQWDDVDIGRWGQMEKASVRATRVELTRSATTDYDRQINSQVTLVVMDFEANVRRDAMYFSAVTLHTTDDRDYQPRPEFSGLARTQPGFTRRGAVVFEVPNDRVPGSELRVDRDGAAFDVYSSAVRIDLGIPQDFVHDPGPVAVAEPVVEVTP